MIIKLNNFVVKNYSTTGVSNLSSSSLSDKGTFCNILLSNIGAITVVTMTIQIIIEIISPVIMSDNVVVATATISAQPLLLETFQFQLKKYLILCP